MKKLISILLAACMISGCGLRLLNPTTECIIPSQGVTVTEYCAEISTESYICELAKDRLDPCGIHRVLEIAAKEGLILEGYTAEEFSAWAETVKVRVNAGITVSILKDIVMAEITKINSMAGMQLLIFGEMFLELPQDQILPEADAILIVAAIDDLVSEVSKLDIWIN